MSGVCTNCRRPDVEYVYERNKVNLCDDCYSMAVVVRDEDGPKVLYVPQPHQQVFHESQAPNLLALGTRGTGKSTTLRWDAIIRCLMFPGFKALIIRRNMGDLRMSHLEFIGAEITALGCGYYRETTFDVKFDNGSKIQFSHCDTLKDVLKYLSSEWDYIGFDELSTFTLHMFLKISAAARSPEVAPYVALVRCCSNPLGPGAAWMQAWFVKHVVDLAEFEDYRAEDFEMIFSMLDENVYVNRVEYERRLKNLPAQVRAAWLHGEFVIEGAYFPNFQWKSDEDKKPWHVIPALPLWQTQFGFEHLLDLKWVSIYRAVDWGYAPDPAVCLWIAVLPNKRAYVFKEMKWTRTIAKKVAKDIVKASEGMHIIETFADPTMEEKTGEDTFSIGEQFELNGVPLTYSQNSRELYGYAVNEYLDELLEDGRPKIQIVEKGCPELIRTFPLQTMDVTDTRKLANGEDHYVVALAYFAMGQARPSRDPALKLSMGLPRWMQPKPRHRRRW